MGGLDVVGDCVKILAVYNTTYKNNSKIALIATCRKQFK